MGKSRDIIGNVCRRRKTVGIWRKIVAEMSETQRGETFKSVGFVGVGPAAVSMLGARRSSIKRFIQRTM